MEKEKITCHANTEQKKQKVVVKKDAKKEI